MLRALNAVRPVRWACAVGLLGCHHVPQSSSPDLSGLRFVGSSQISGIAGDSVTFHLFAHNRTRNRVRIEYSGNFTPLLRVYREGEHSAPVWEFSKWQMEDGPAVFSGYRPQVIWMGATMVTSLEPGAGMEVDRWSVPARVILGDSLPPGRYEFEMQSGIYGSPKNFVRVGQLTLARPPILRTTVVRELNASQQGVVRGQVIDSLSDEVIRFAFLDFARVDRDGQLRPIAENASNHLSSDSVNAVIPQDGADGFIVQSKGYYPVTVRFPLQKSEAYRVRVMLQRNPNDQPPAQTLLPKPIKH